MAVWASPDRPVLGRLALALVRPWARLLAYWGTGVERAAIRVAVLRAGLPRSRRPLALPLALLRGRRCRSASSSWASSALSAAGRARRRRPVPAPAGRLDRLLPGPLQHEDPGLRRRAAVPARLPALGLADRPGVRLALAADRGRDRLARRDARRRSSPPRRIGVVATYPFGLSYYNLLVGGLPGAERLGLELTYWSDAVDDVLLDRLARDAPARRHRPRWCRRSTPAREHDHGIQPHPGSPRDHPPGRCGRDRAPSGSSSRVGPPTGRRAGETVRRRRRTPGRDPLAGRASGSRSSGISRARRTAPTDRTARNSRLPSSRRADDL